MHTHDDPVDDLPGGHAAREHRASAWPAASTSLRRPTRPAVFAVFAVCVALAAAGCGSAPAGGTHGGPAAPPALGTAVVTFGSGRHQVGQELAPGTYRTRAGSEGCYWARLSGLSGTLQDVIENGKTIDPAVVTILSTDEGFESRDCAPWTSDLARITTGASFGDGELIVGTDIEPGTWHSAGQAGCYWARLRGFTHDPDDVVADGSTASPVTVTITPTDRGFRSVGCGTWTRS